LSSLETRARLTLAGLTLFALCGACSGNGAKSPGKPPDGVPGEPVVFRDCRGRAFTAGAAEPWKRITSEAIVLLGAPNHSGQDVIARPGDAPKLPGRFTYGLTSKDLEGEVVRVRLDDCTGWRSLGDQITDGEGRVLVAAPADLGAGVYEVRFEVAGDRTVATSFLWLFPAGTRMVVMNFDGTLNDSEYAVFRQILAGSYVPPALAGAVDLTRAYSSIGYVVLYLTGRPYWLSQKTREWLATEGLAKGPLHVAESTAQALPVNSAVGDYKKAYLTSLTQAGYVLDFAHGNTTTDIHAYLGAGILPDKVFIIGEDGGKSGTIAAGDNWTARAAQVAALPPVTQPFTR
jgi:hypothetical protein